jgi:hypothetical protein
MLRSVNVNLITAALVAMLACELAAQNLGLEGASAIPEGDRSPYIGRPVADPEGLPGLWEVSNGHGGAVGIHLTLATTVATDAKSDGKTLAGVEQLWQYLEVSVYERHGPTLIFGEENYFSDSPKSASVTMEDGRLQLHFVSQRPNTPPVDLDLVKRPGDRWVGRLHRGSFDSDVTLKRPGVDVKKSSAITGTWLGTMNGCMHIVEQAPSVFTGWSDSLQVPGTMRFAPSVRKPLRLLETYGTLMKVQAGADGNVSFEFNPFTPICCSHTFVGKPGADGRTMEGAWPPGPNQAPRAASWIKMAHDSCWETGISP